MAEEQIILDIVIDDSKTNQSIGSMKKEIRELQSVLTTLDPNSEEFAKAAARAGELKDNIEDANDAVNNMKGEPIESLKNNFEGLGGKIKSLDFEGATKSLNAMGTSVGKLNLGNIIKQVGQMGGAFLKLAGQIALSLGPLIAVAGAIAAVVYALKLQTEAEEKAEAAHKTFMETMSDSGVIMQEHAERLKALQEEYNKTELELQLATGEITKLEYDQLAVRDETMKKFTEANSKNYNNLKTIQQNYTNDVKAENERYAMIFRIGTDGIEEDRAEHKQKLLDIEKTKNEQINKENKAYQDERLTLEQTYSNKIELILRKNNEKEQQAATDKWISLNKAADDYFKELEKKYYGAYYTAIVTYDDELKKYNEYLANKTWSLAQYNEAVMMLQITQKKKLDELEKLDPDELSPEMQLTWEAYEFWLNTQIKKREEQEKFATETIGLENELEAWKTGQYAKDIMSFEWSNTQKLEVLKRFYEAGKIQEEDYNAAVEQTWQNRLSLWQNMNGAMANMSESFFSFLENINDRNEKKQRKIKKAAFTVNKVTSAIDTAIAGAKGVIEAAPVVPLQILVAAQTAAAIASILSKKFPEEGTSGAGAGNEVGGLNTMTAIPTQTQLYNTGGGTPTTFASLTSSNQGMINRVYVVESDITSTQANVAKVNVVSSF